MIFCYFSKIMPKEQFLILFKKNKYAKKSKKND